MENPIISISSSMPRDGGTQTLCQIKFHENFFYYIFRIRCIPVFSLKYSLLLYFQHVLAYSREYAPLNMQIYYSSSIMKCIEVTTILFRIQNFPEIKYITRF